MEIPTKNWQVLPMKFVWHCFANPMIGSLPVVIANGSAPTMLERQKVILIPWQVPKPSNTKRYDNQQTTRTVESTGNNKDAMDSIRNASSSTRIGLTMKACFILTISNLTRDFYFACLVFKKSVQEYSGSEDSSDDKGKGSPTALVVSLVLEIQGDSTKYVDQPFVWQRGNLAMAVVSCRVVLCRVVYLICPYH